MRGRLETATVLRFRNSTDKQRGPFNWACWDLSRHPGPFLTTPDIADSDSVVPPTVVRSMGSGKNAVVIASDDVSEPPRFQSEVKLATCAY